MFAIKYDRILMLILKLGELFTSSHSKNIRSIQKGTKRNQRAGGAQLVFLTFERVDVSLLVDPQPVGFRLRNFLGVQRRKGATFWVILQFRMNLKIHAVTRFSLVKLE